MATSRASRPLLYCVMEFRNCVNFRDAQKTKQRHAKCGQWSDVWPHYTSVVSIAYHIHRCTISKSVRYFGGQSIVGAAHTHTAMDFTNLLHFYGIYSRHKSNIRFASAQTIQRNGCVCLSNAHPQNVIVFGCVYKENGLAHDAKQ